MLVCYLAVVNLLAFALMAADKLKAIKGARRIPEKVLFLSALIGGSMGALVGMFSFRHKTRHLSFVIGLPVILLAQLVAALWFLS